MKILKTIGRWKSYFELVNETLEHTLSFKQREDKKIIASGTNQQGSRFYLVLKYDPENNLLTGTWEEENSKSKTKRHGAVQFVLNKDYDHADGMWTGFDGQKVTSGSWKLERILLA
jgi:hypothetical protein